MTHFKKAKLEVKPQDMESAIGSRQILVVNKTHKIGFKAGLIYILQKNE